MRIRWLGPLLFWVPAAAAQTPPSAVETPAVPTSYDMLRFNESYSALAGGTNRGDWLDSIKYIPLQTGIPNSYLTFGGELRERFEGANNVDFGVQPGNDHYWLQRITLLG